MGEISQYCVIFCNRKNKTGREPGVQGMEARSSEEGWGEETADTSD